MSDKKTDIVDETEDKKPEGARNSFFQGIVHGLFLWGEKVNRLQYWVGGLISVSLILTILYTVSTYVLASETSAPWMVYSFLTCVALLWLAFANLGVSRCRDIGHPVYPVILVHVVLLSSGFIKQYISEESVAYSVIYLCVFLYLFVYLGGWKSKE